MGIIGKIAGCGAVFKAFKYNWKESAIGGIGMMARGEVALIVTSAVTAEALGSFALGEEFMLMTVLLILLTSILTPILLKTLYKRVPDSNAPVAAIAAPLLDNSPSDCCKREFNDGGESGANEQTSGKCESDTNSDEKPVN